MELLERTDELTALAAARASAAAGDGRAVLVTGEPGIGKTALVTHYVRGLDADARILWGTCDDLTIPRPLGALRDLAGDVSPRLARALREGAGPHQTQALLVAELELEPRPTVLVLEDVHWADEATVDVIAFLGKRIARLPALLVITFRGGEVAPGHPLHAALGAVAAEASVFLPLEPLSFGAVASLAGEHADAVYTATGGNPFYVTELLGAGPRAELPASVATAVLGRAARLDDEARRLVELVSVVPARTETALLDRIVPEWAAAAEEPERRGLLDVGPKYVRFRHELARNAIRSSIPVARRRLLHGEILAALLAADADPADVVQHAEAAGDEAVVAEYALVAARRAAALEANREAHSHYRRAAEFADRRPPAQRAGLFEELAQAAYTVGRLDDAFPAIASAIALHDETLDRAAVGRCTRILSRFHWYAGDGDDARRRALEAVAILEPLGESRELARAYSGVAQLAMLADEYGDALDWGERALALALRLGDERTRAHALVSLGIVDLQQDADDTARLLEAYATADAVGDRHEATRALLGLGYAFISWARPAEASAYTDQGLAYAREHEVDTLSPYLAAMTAWLRLRAGDWAGAEAAMRTVLARASTVADLLLKTVLAELAVRRGDPDACERLADVREHATRTAELQRIAPVLEIEVSAALTGAGAMPVERIRTVVDDIVEARGLRGVNVIQVAAWAAVAGLEVELDPPRSGPYAAMARRDWAGAADAFGEIGWPYERALMLSLLDDERRLTDALAIARSLGAKPLARQVSRRMRSLGMTVPRGRRVSTLANPAGLTTRELDVLPLLAEGLTNAEIASRIVVSPRTVEHHVTAILRKLDAATRRDVARRALELGLLETAGPAPRRHEPTGRRR